MGLPAETTLIFRDRGLGIEVLQQGVAFGLVHPDNVLGKGDIDIDGLATRLWVGAHDGVLHHWIELVEGFDLFGCLALLGHDFAEVREIMQRDGPFDLGLDLVGQAVIGRIHIGKEGVAADRRDLDGPQDRTQ